MASVYYLSNIEVKLLRPWLNLPLFALSWPFYAHPESSESSPSTQCHSWTLWLHPEPTRVSAMHSQTLRVDSLASSWRIPNLMPLRPFPFLASSQFPISTTHSWSDAFQPSLFCVKSIPDVSLVSWLWSGEVQSHTFLAQCVLVCLFSPSIYLYVPLCLIVHCPPFISLSHPQFPISVHPCLIYLYSISPSTLFSYPIHSLWTIPDCSDQPDPYHTRTCINTLVTSCCSSVW